jgi:hypothetical protein
VKFLSQTKKEDTMPIKKAPVKRAPKVTKAPPKAAARMKEDETPVQRKKRLEEEKKMARRAR